MQGAVGVVELFDIRGGAGSDDELAACVVDLNFAETSEHSLSE